MAGLLTSKENWRQSKSFSAATHLGIEIAPFGERGAERRR
jgi:hypothetical protein